MFSLSAMTHFGGAEFLG